MKEEIKMSVVFGSLIGGIFLMIFGIVSIIEYQRIQEKCTYLEKQIEQQTMLIEYLKDSDINE